ncbi:MAG: Ig-like domain-containing protein [Candidatus Paceibacterota bacterium]|jgi:uncharacterized membrane protein YgcG
MFERVKAFIRRGLKLIALILAAAILVSALVMIPGAVTNGGQSTPGNNDEEYLQLKLSESSTEVGEVVSITADTSFSSEEYNFRWEISDESVGKLSSNGRVATFSARSPGETMISLTVHGKTVSEKIIVYPQADIQANLEETWMYVGNSYAYSVETPGVEIQKEYAVTVGKPQFIGGEVQGVYAPERLIYFEECGNFLLVIEGKALSDGRAIAKEVPFSILKEVERGYYQFSLADENLISLTKNDEVSIEHFIAKEIGVEVSLQEVLEEGKKVEVNSISTKYLFYRDSSREDRICYQKDVKSEALDIPTKTFYSTRVKANDSRYWVIAIDGIVVAVHPDISYHHLKEVNLYSGGDGGGGGDGGSPSSGGGSSGGGPSPSPDV